MILGVLRCILAHSGAYSEAHRAHCLLSYWKTGNHLHQLGSTIPMPIHRRHMKQILSVEAIVVLCEALLKMDGSLPRYAWW